MRHKIAGRRLSRPTGHRWALYRNQVADLLTHGRIITMALVTDKKVVEKLFNEVAPTYSSRVGGYTRLIKLRRRVGDNARLVQIQLIE